MASRKLLHYFQAKKITMPSQYPIGEVLWNNEATCRLGKWATKLAPFDLHYVARTAKKSLVLANFVAEWTWPTNQVGLSMNEDCWTMFSNGSWSHTGAGTAVILTSPTGTVIR
ncbi:hypothetical protein E2562_019512 [Oryza meyeriana var. granulata]|uniref:Uncharacterized protein n=1 Tax=Oryza meyeriana var. granulata TaxID=110450 RepID=A0A6G1CGT2_9ORYZ|nr:hypothetical protein E2562_019512 [Oryza meyeriana var. granulata]